MRSGASVLRFKVALVAQVALAAALLCMLAFAPPDRGQMMLIPLDGNPMSPTLLKQLPVAAVGPGPLPGSLIVFGSSEGQFLPLLEEGVLILSAPQALCGASHSESNS